MNSLQKLLQTAVQYNASDLYVSSGSRPIIRVNGELFPIDEHPILTAEQTQTYLNEIMSDVHRTRLAEQSDVDFSIDIQEIARFRVNIFTQKDGLSGIFRIIPETPLSLDELKLPDQVKTLTTLKSGLILLTGPAGSGKSTTLAGLIHAINTQQRKHLITIEDPIEFIHATSESIIEQREVGTHTHSFEGALRATLREDPDVILVGEMRDLETITLALTAAETGHLVLSTLHTQGAANSINRIIDVFPPNQQAQVRTQLADTLQAVLWQELLPATQETINGTKRIAALEVLRTNHALRNLIRKGHTHQIESVIETGRNEGMQTMKNAIKTLLEKRWISEETFQNAYPNEEAPK